MTFRYLAPKPKEEKKYLPLVRVGELLSYYIRSVSASLVDTHPQARTQHRMKLIKLDKRTAFYHKGQVITHDGETLNSLEIYPMHLEANRYIIKFETPGVRCDDLLEFYAYDAIRLKARVVGFDYRKQKIMADIKAFDSYITDGIAQVQRLLDAGALASQIVLDGFAVGAVIATRVAAHFHKLGLKLYLWNDRSFSSTAKAMQQMGISPDDEQENDVAALYNLIDSAYKRHCFLSRHDKHYASGDIAKSDSLHAAVKDYEKKRGINTGYKLTCTEIDNTETDDCFSCTSDEEASAYAQENCHAAHRLFMRQQSSRANPPTQQQLFERFVAGNIFS